MPFARSLPVSALRPESNGAALRELAYAQAIVSLGQLADQERRRIIVELYREGVTQVELSARLTEASERVGGQPVGLDAVQKLIKRWGRRV